MWWLVFRHNGNVVVSIQPAYSLIGARLRARLADIEGEFVEGHQFDAAMAKKVPTDMIGRALIRKEAEELLQRLTPKR
jgi:hypothetical protein